MISKFILLADSIIIKVNRLYWRKVFFSRTCTEKGLQVLGKIYINATNIKAGKNLALYPGVYFWGNGEIIIGDNVDIGVGTIIFAKKKVRIGNNVIIAGQCYIIDSNHSTIKEQIIRNQPMNVADEGISIDDDVWIGAGVKIIKGAIIGKGSVIGAMSLVNNIIPEYSIAYGIPAKRVKER